MYFAWNGCFGSFEEPGNVSGACMVTVLKRRKRGFPELRSSSTSTARSAAERSSERFGSYSHVWYHFSYHGSIRSKAGSPAVTSAVWYPARARTWGRESERTARKRSRIRSVGWLQTPRATPMRPSGDGKPTDWHRGKKTPR